MRCPPIPDPAPRTAAPPSRERRKGFGVAARHVFAGPAIRGRGRRTLRGLCAGKAAPGFDVIQPRQSRISRRTKSAQAASSSRVTYSSALWARAIEPGPITTAGTPPSRANSPPSVP